MNRNLLTLRNILQIKLVLNDGHKAFLYSANPSLAVHIHQERPPPPPMSGPVSPRHCLSRMDAPTWVTRTWPFICRAVLPSPPEGERAVAIRGRDFSGCSSDFMLGGGVGGGGGRERESHNCCGGDLKF